MLAEADLRSLTRKELQACAKKHGVKANGSNDAIVALLLALVPQPEEQVQEEEAEAVAVQEEVAMATEEVASAPTFETEAEVEAEAELEVETEGFSEEQLSALGRKELQALAREHGVKANGSSKAIIAALLALRATSSPVEEESKVEEAPVAAKPSVVVEMTLDEYLKESPVKSTGKAKKGKTSRGSKKSTDSKDVALPSVEDIKRAARQSAAAELLAKGTSTATVAADNGDDENDDDTCSIAFTSLRKDMKVMVRVGEDKKFVTIKRKSNTYVRVELENGDEEKLDDSHMFFQHNSLGEEDVAPAVAQARPVQSKLKKRTAFAPVPTPAKTPFATIKSPLGRSTPGLGPAERKQVRPKVSTPAIYRQPSILPKKNRLTEVREELAKKRKSQANQAMAAKRVSSANEAFDKITKGKIAGSSRPTKPAVAKPGRSKMLASKSEAATAKSLATTTPGKTPDFKRIHKQQFEAQPSIAERGKRRAPSRIDGDGQASKRKKEAVTESEQPSTVSKPVAPSSAVATKKRRKSTVPQPFQLGSTRENFRFKPYSGAVPPAADSKTDENEAPAAKNVTDDAAKPTKSNKTAAKPQQAKGKGKVASRVVRPNTTKRAAVKT